MAYSLTANHMKLWQCWEPLVAWKSSTKMTGDVCATIPFSSAALRGGLLYLVLLVTWLRGACGSCARSGSSSINGKCSTTWASPVVSDYGWPLSIGEPQHQLRGFAVNVFYVNCFGGLGPQRLLSQPVAASPTSPVAIAPSWAKKVLGHIWILSTCHPDTSHIPTADGCSLGRDDWTVSCCHFGLIAGWWWGSCMISDAGMLTEQREGNRPHGLTDVLTNSNKQWPQTSTRKHVSVVGPLWCSPKYYHLITRILHAQVQAWKQNSCWCFHICKPDVSMTSLRDVKWFPSKKTRSFQPWPSMILHPRDLDFDGIMSGWGLFMDKNPARITVQYGKCLISCSFSYMSGG